MTPALAVGFDHLVIGADSLEQGAAWARATLGRALGPGGAHPLMGTHNLLARLGADDAPAGYLEVIAIDPAAAPPGRPRWFGLDAPTTRARLAERPRPIAFALAVADLEAAVARCRAAGWEPGEIVAASRGDLSWRITLPEDGGVALGVLPSLIAWDGRVGAPVERMTPLGLRLAALRLTTPEPDRIAAALGALDAVGAMAAAGVALELHRGPEPALEAAFGPPRIARSL